MSRYVHPGLLADIRRGATTLCQLLRIDPVQSGFVGYGATSTNRSMYYDAGDGVRLYSAPIGFDATEIHASADLSVDNAEAKQLMPVYDLPISEEAIAAGMYDYAEFVLYLVNYDNLSPGRHVVLHKGNIGKVSVRDDGLSFVTELLGLSAKLKQEVCTKYTKTCRAIDGTQRIGSATPGEQVRRDPCEVDFSGYWKSSTVSEVGMENTLTFRIDPDDIDGDWSTPDFFAPGRVTFTAGRNAGRTIEIKSTTSDGWITLQYETGFAIAEDDELDYREGCTFIYDDGDKGCLAHAGPDRVRRFKGYPRIPTENSAQLATPGATAMGSNVPFAAASGEIEA